MERREFLRAAALTAPALALAQEPGRPNVVIILVDDMGYSDIGCYGGEIPTPHIDRLAANGLRFSQFYNTARCCPTRASLMTGLHPHQTGVGHMTNRPTQPQHHNYGVDAYQGFLNRNCVTLAEVLGEAGYHTYMAGKWHLGQHGQEKWPRQRGFERYYGILAGACSYFAPTGARGLWRDNEHVEPEGEDYYTTDAFTDYAIRFLEEQEDENPFFLYLAYNAPHWPLHAKEEDINQFVGKYTIGWDALRKQRFERMVELGLIARDWGLSPRDPGARAWSALTPIQKEQLDYRMAVYAAQIHCVDYNVGRVIDSLEKEGKLDNTLILFLSDNGGCAEPYDDLGGRDFKLINDPSYGGNVSYGQGWANASNTPFRRFKVWTNEGGISTPLIAHWPARIREQAGEITDSPGYLLDIMPTVLEVTGAEYPRVFHGKNRIPPLEGRSLLPAFETGEVAQQEWMFWEHQNHCAVRWGKWKALQDLGETEGEWELYDMEDDRTELHDLASAHPEIVERMSAEWNRWAWRVGVFPQGTKANAVRREG